MSHRKNTTSTGKYSAIKPRDIDEVSFLTQYAGVTPTPAPSSTSRVTGRQPLVDIVNPQPKAFFAYLQMPPKPQAKKGSATRLSRNRRRSVQ